MKPLISALGWWLSACTSALTAEGFAATRSGDETPPENPAVAAPDLADDEATLAVLRRQLREVLLDPCAFSNEHLLLDPIAVGALRALVETQRSDGTWPDIDYADPSRSHWPTWSHLERARDLAKAWNQPGGPLQGDAAVKEAVLRALKDWLDKDYRNSNWWFNEIGVPRTMSELVLLMEAELSPGQHAEALRIVGRAQIGRTGQNLLWLAGITLTRGLSENDPEVVRTARAAILGELVAGREEGLQADHSFHQHGPQLQFGNYGLAYVVDLVKWSRALRGTRLAFDPEAGRLLGDYLLHGLGNTVWQGQMDINACARQLFANATTRKAAALGQLLRDQALADPDRAHAYAEAAERCQAGGAGGTPGNSMFWHSEYMTHREPGYFASVRMSSRRVIGAEAGNGENLQGYHLGDGALYLYQKGGEYTDIFPLWDWRRLPGITAPQRPGPLPVLDWDGYRLDTDFAGGVSDGRVGASALDFRRDGVAARKAWFFFTGRIVCLGAGVQSDREDVVLTSVAQQHRRGPIWLGPEAGTAGPAEGGGQREVATPGWLWHDGTGVVFPSAGRVVAESVRRSGRWTDVVKFGAKEPVHGEVFSSWFDHGTAPQNEGYAYVLMPGATKEATAGYLRAPDLSILANTPAIQAACSAEVLMAVFYEPGRLATPCLGALTVDEPCLLLARRNEAGSWILTVADPTRLANRVTVQIGPDKWTAELARDPANAGRSVTAIRQ